MSRRAYGFLLLAYPRDFRSRFGDQMAQVAADLASHTSPLRLWPRILGDVVASAPRQRMESLMDRFSPGSRAYVVFVLAAASALAVVLVGTAVPHSLPILALGLAVLAFRRRRQLGHLAATRSRWYLFLAAGAATLASIAVLARILPDYDGALADTLWYAAFFAFLFAWLLIATAAVLAATTAWNHFKPTHHPA